jgi:uncharacterized protein YkwD
MNAMGSAIAVAENRRGRRRSVPRPLGAEHLEPRHLLTVVLTPHEQLLLELINRARAAPQAEAERYGIDLNEGLAAGTISTAPKQPLAPHAILIDAAGRHAQDMLDRDYFAHDTPEGRSPTSRAAALGYSGGVGENIAWGGSTGAIDEVAQTLERHEGLFLSSGHRRNLLRADYREAGPGVRFGEFTTDGETFNASMVVENFGIGTRAHLTGVAFTDTVATDRFYTVGEGLADIVVTATSAAGTTFSTTTGPSGGYALPLVGGTYSVVFSRGTESTEATQVSISGGRNVKLDFDGAFVTQPPDPTDPSDPPPEAAFVVESIMSPAPAAYRAGSTITVVLKVSSPASVTGRPTLPLVVGSRTVQAPLSGGSGTTGLEFTYRVGRAISAAEVRLGTAIRIAGRSGITSADGTPLATVLPEGIANAPLEGVSIDTAPPRAVGPVGLPAPRLHVAGEALRFSVTFDEAVNVGGTPFLSLSIAPGSAGLRRATYVSSSDDARTLTFEYVVQATDGSVSPRPLRLWRMIGGGTLADAAGNAATRRVTPPLTSGIRIGTIA